MFTDKGVIISKRVNRQTDFPGCFLCTVPYGKVMNAFMTFMVWLEPGIDGISQVPFARIIITIAILPIRSMANS